MEVDAGLPEALTAALRTIPDFPRAGIAFKDITPVLADAALFTRVTRAMAAPFRDRGVTHVAGIESRGFVLGAPVAQHLGAGFIPLRKPGKLPYTRRRVEYSLEYGSDALEAHADACGPEHRVLIVDDVLATGGTAGAAAQLLTELGANLIGASFLLVIDALGAEGRLGGRLREVRTLVRA